MPTGIPQGLPISLIPLMLFNAPQIRSCFLRGGSAESEGSRWVGDVAIIAESESYKDNVDILPKALSQAEIWARRHAAK